MTMAIDRQGMIDSILDGYGTVMKYCICPNERGYRQEDPPIPYDPAGAKRLLAEAGYPNGFKTRINTTAATRLMSQFIQAQLAEVGIQMAIEVMDQGSMFRRGYATLDLSGFSTAGWYTSTHFEPWGWAGLVRPFQDPVWNKLKALYMQSVLAHKIEDRQRLADQIREIQLKEVPVIPLAVVSWPWVVRAKIIEWPNVPTFDLIATSNLAKMKK